MQNRRRLPSPSLLCVCVSLSPWPSSPLPGPPGPPCPRSPSPPCLCTLCGQRRVSPLALTPLSPVASRGGVGRRPAKLAQPAAPRHAILYAASPSSIPDPPDTVRRPLRPSGALLHPTHHGPTSADKYPTRTVHSLHSTLTSLTLSTPQCTAKRAEPRPQSSSCP